MKEALNGSRRRRGAKDREIEIERLRREVEKNRRIIAEVVEENLELRMGL